VPLIIATEVDAHVEERVTLDHGEGGAATSRLVRELFLAHLGGPAVLEDAAVVTGGERIALTTDSFVVQPIRFPGGDIGRLSIAGTVNDLAVMGAEPKYITAAFVLEEGLPISELESVVVSMAAAAREAGVQVVAGDTKVVRRGEADQLFINTSGVGILPPERTLSSASCKKGDVVLISGPIGDHGTAVMVEREGFDMRGDLMSDCQPLWDLASALLEAAPDTRCMRDPTRGGLATALVEIAAASEVGVLLEEEKIPVRRPVRAACDLLGLDPLYVACEGRLIAVVPEEQAEDALDAMRHHDRGGASARIGVVVNDPPGLTLATLSGGMRPLVALEGAQLPRIC
jgi:hydrogenase expression/formation protein HypE